MKAALSWLMTLPLVLIGCLTLPVSGSTSRSATAEYVYLGSHATPTLTTARRRKDRRPAAVLQAMQRAYALEQGKELAAAMRAYRRLLGAIAGDDRFVETRDDIKSALARAEKELANASWG